MICCVDLLIQEIDTSTEVVFQFSKALFTSQRIMLRKSLIESCTISSTLQFSLLSIESEATEFERLRNVALVVDELGLEFFEVPYFAEHYANRRN